MCLHLAAMNSGSLNLWKLNSGRAVDTLPPVNLHKEVAGSTKSWESDTFSHRIHVWYIYLHFPKEVLCQKHVVFRCVPICHASTCLSSVLFKQFSHNCLELIDFGFGDTLPNILSHIPLCLTDRQFHFHHKIFFYRAPGGFPPKLMENSLDQQFRNPSNAGLIVLKQTSHTSGSKPYNKFCW